jgi:aminopeptidase N
VTQECLKRFDAMKKPEDIEPDLRGVIYHTAVRLRNDEKTFDKLFKFHEETALSEERTLIASSLTGFKDPDLVKRALKLIKTDSVRLQDVSYWIAYSFANRWGRESTWKWLKNNWGWLEENLGNDLGFFRFPIYVANAFSSSKFLGEFKEFFVPKISPAFERSVNQGIEVLTWQSAWKDRDFKTVEAFFKAKQ